LRPAADGPSVIACSTCRYDGESREDAAGVRGGARLAGLLRSLATCERAYAGIAVEEMPCLFACKDFCAVHIRAPGKIGYVLGRFTPDEAAARAILDYAARHAESDQGRVAYADWPEGVKGHFLVRVPPPGFVAE
jgi:predicted metal-binding protein